MEKKYEFLIEENKNLKLKCEELIKENIELKKKLGLLAQSEETNNEVISRKDKNKKLLNGINKYSSPKEKIELFLGLFKGREDVFARRWESKNGKSGYSPACSNEWKTGVCNMVMPISWKGTLQQYVGRLHRDYANKEVVTVYDYVDEQVPMLKRMYHKRVKGYKNIGYEFTVSQ